MTFLRILRPRVLQHVAVALAIAPCLNSPVALAGSELIAATGQSIFGVQFKGVSPPTVNDVGKVAFMATLQQGIGGVTASNDRAVWTTDAGSHQLLARTANGAPGGGSYLSFNAATIDNAGGVVVVGDATGGAGRVWRYSAAGDGSVVAAVGVPGVPGAEANRFQTIALPLFHTSGGEVVFNAQLIPEGIVTFDNDRGVWRDADGNGSLVAREAISPVPGVSGGAFSTLAAQAANSYSQVALLAGMVIQGDVSLANSAGVWRLAPDGGELIARRSSGNVPEVPDASFSAFDGITINAAGTIALTGELELAGAIIEGNRRGIWAFGEAAAELRVRSGSAAPGVPGAIFSSFGQPLLNDAGSILFGATLAAGAGGVNESNASGLWNSDPDGSITLVARAGVDGVPGVANASFADFTALAYNANGAAAVRASLTSGVGGVTDVNDHGIWLFTATGGTLVAREGDTLAGRVIQSLEFTAGSSGGDGRARSLNDENQLAFKAVFTNGDEGIFLFTPTAAGSPSADFTFDGVVDSADLLRWRQNAGQLAGASRSQGDVDGDGDVDGRDLLVWQRQLGSTTAAFSAVPEPSVAVALLPSGLASSLILRVRRRVARQLAIRRHGRLKPPQHPHRQIPSQGQRYECSFASSRTTSTRESAASTGGTT